MKILLALLILCALLLPGTAEAKGSSGGRSGGFRSSSRSSFRSTPKATVKPKVTTKPKAAAVKPKPTVKKATPAKKPAVKKVASKPVPKASTKKPANKKYSNSKGTVGQNGYTPRFNGGYVAPANSVVYYPSHSALDYLPWIYLFSQQHSPQHDNATVVQPNGKEVKVQPVKEGTDGMAVFNWIIMILLAILTIGGIVWLVNRLSSRATA